jgi:predicted porin
MLKKLYILFAIVLFIPCIAESQVKDFDTWITLELKGSLFKHVKYDLTPELRLWDNSTRVESMLTELDVSVPFAKYFELGVLYRYQLDITEPDYNQRINRFGVFGQITYKVKRLKISYTGTYQQEYTNLNTSELGNVPENQHRHKIGLKYNIRKSKITPFASAEMYFTVKPAWKAQESKLRTSIGLEYKFSKKINAYIDYKYQKQFNNTNAKTDYILGMGMEYDL